jgi:enoyl-[acyl-carrier protein] reductase II
VEGNRLCQLLGIKYPVIQAGMIWISGAKLAAAAANSGILGIIGAGSMKPDLLKIHLKKARALSPDGILGINVPLLYEGAQQQLETALEEGIKIFITSAGSPKKFTSYLKDQGAIVGHVVSNPILAKKCEAAGVDFVVAEGFEAGGHNGRDEITTLALIPQVVKEVEIPVVAAGGIGNGQAIAAALCLGADGVQMGTRFIMTRESSGHQAFKEAILKADATSTMLSMKKAVPVRLLKNHFYEQITRLEEQGADAEQLNALLGKGRAKRGMLEGDLDEGELETGQIVGLIDDLPTVAGLVEKLIKEYNTAVCSLKKME